MEAFPLPNQEATTVARTLVDEDIPHQSNFTLIRADNLKAS